MELDNSNAYVTKPNQTCFARNLEALLCVMLPSQIHNEQEPYPKYLQTRRRLISLAVTLRPWKRLLKIFRFTRPLAGGSRTLFLSVSLPLALSSTLIILHSIIVLCLSGSVLDIWVPKVTVKQICRGQLESEEHSRIYIVFV